MDRLAMPTQLLDIFPKAVMRSGPSEDQAASAWSRVQPHGADRPVAELMKLRTKSAIYRLPGAGPQGSDVIAKRCLSPTAQLERRIYQEILPSLPLPGLCCYGCIAEETTGFHWLFLEDAGTLVYEPADREHRSAIARWMARLHSLAGHSELAASLPERGSGFYLEQLRLARQNIINSYSNPALQGQDLAVVQTLEAQCDLIEASWSQIETQCAGIPPTLVHGDIKPNNLRLRSSPNGVQLLTLDWELAGWGIPAADLMKCPDLELYLTQLSKTWPLDREQMGRLAELGKLFRALISVYWASLKLHFPWVHGAVVKLRFPQAALAQAIQVLALH